MKKINKVIISLVLAIVMLLPVFVLIGCDNNDKNELTKIAIYEEFKTDYFVGDELDVANGKIKCIYKNADPLIVEITADMVSSFSTQTEGIRECIVTYKNKTALVNYTVSAKRELKLGDMFHMYQYITGSVFLQTISVTAENEITLYSHTQYKDYDSVAILTVEKDSTNMIRYNITSMKLVQHYEDPTKVDYIDTPATGYLEYTNEETVDLLVFALSSGETKHLTFKKYPVNNLLGCVYYKSESIFATPGNGYSDTFTIVSTSEIICTMKNGSETHVMTINVEREVVNYHVKYNIVNAVMDTGAEFGLSGYFEYNDTYSLNYYLTTPSGGNTSGTLYAWYE